MSWILLRRINKRLNKIQFKNNFKFAKDVVLNSKKLNFNNITLLL